jgi:hypothetical protein
MEISMEIIWAILLAAGIPSSITGLVITRFIKRQDNRDKAREEINVLLVQGIGASISLGEANAIAIRDGKTNGETKEALKYAMDAKHNITNFLTKQGVKQIY